MNQSEVKLFTLQVLDLFFLIVKLYLPFSHIYITCLAMLAPEVSDIHKHGVLLQLWNGQSM